VTTQNDDGVKSQEEGPKGAQTLMRALDILDEVIDGRVRAADLARKLGMSRTTTHRLAHALRSRNYLSVTSDGFALGPKLLQLGAMAKEQTDFVRIARPYMELLSERTGFCVFVGKREGDWSRHLDRVTGRQRLRVATAPGDRRPIAETGLGKALLLDEERATLERLYIQSKDGDVKPAKVEAWLKAMAAHAERGIVTHESDLSDGVRSIAAPVRNAEGQICVAISIASAAHYLDDETMKDLSVQVAQTAANISQVLGYVA
jgi:DNA-binding IclR family transcriptional regulator